MILTLLTLLTDMLARVVSTSLRRIFIPMAGMVPDSGSRDGHFWGSWFIGHTRGNFSYRQLTPFGWVLAASDPKPAVVQSCNVHTLAVSRLDPIWEPLWDLSTRFWNGWSCDAAAFFRSKAWMWRHLLQWSWRRLSKKWVLLVLFYGSRWLLKNSAKWRFVEIGCKRNIANCFHTFYKSVITDSEITWMSSTHAALGYTSSKGI